MVKPSTLKPLRDCAGCVRTWSRGVMEPESRRRRRRDHLEHRAGHVAALCRAVEQRRRRVGPQLVQVGRAPSRCPPAGSGRSWAWSPAPGRGRYDGSMATTAPRSLPSSRIASCCSRRSTERCRSLGSYGSARNLRSSASPAPGLVEADQLRCSTRSPGRTSRTAGSCSPRSAPSRDADSGAGARAAAGRLAPRPRPGCHRWCRAARSARPPARAGWPGPRVSGPACTSCHQPRPAARPRVDQRRGPATGARAPCRCREWHRPPWPAVDVEREPVSRRRCRAHVGCAAEREARGCGAALAPNRRRNDAAEAAVAERQQQADDDRVGQQRRAAVADERQRDAGQRHQLEIAADDERRLQHDDQRQPGRQQRLEVVAGARGDVEAALRDQQVQRRRSPRAPIRPSSSARAAKTKSVWMRRDGRHAAHLRQPGAEAGAQDAAAPERVQRRG